MSDTQRIETCCACDVPTGKAGKHDDSLYVYHEILGDIGPFCEACYLLEHIAYAERHRQEVATLRARIEELEEELQDRDDTFRRIVELADSVIAANQTRMDVNPMECINANALALHLAHKAKEGGRA